jgi:transmembrane 9 superfamily member 2/4
MRSSLQSASSTAAAVVSTLLLLAPNQASGFYLPGVAPNTYAQGGKVALNVNHLTPALSMTDAQLHSVFSFDYYHPAFRFCRPQDGPKKVSESLGSILFGDRILTSPFELKMAQNESCKALCTTSAPFDARSAKFVNRRIAQNYNLNWLVDGLPAGQLLKDPLTNSEFYSPGFSLGSVTAGKDNKDQYNLNNHFDIVIDYHEVAKSMRSDETVFRVVGVIVQPSSRNDNKDLGNGKAECGSDANDHLLSLKEDGDTTVTWTYGVWWRPSTTAWATRWDKYLHVYDPRIQWFSLVTSAIIVTFLAGMVAAILVRALRKDIARYNRLDQLDLADLSGTSAQVEDGVQEDSGWKLVHGDVFRAPTQPLLLSIFVGSGCQLFMMVGLTIIFALMGFLSPSNRGLLGTVMILLYTMFGFIGGYVSARIYKAFGGEFWKSNIILTPFFIPGVVFSVFFLLNLFLWAKQSSGAVPFTTMLGIVVIWFIISVPLSFGGSWVGFRQQPIPAPVRTNQIPRQIPPSSSYLRPLPSMALVGILPFGAIFVELYFIMNSIWFSKVYYMFGFLFLSYGLMTITCAAVTILMIYFLLCSEDYHWQWRAFFTAGASAFYVFLNALLYWFTKLSLGSLTSHILYLGYSLLISFLFFVLTGTSLSIIKLIPGQFTNELIQVPSDSLLALPSSTKFTAILRSIKRFSMVRN